MTNKSSAEIPVADLERAAAFYCGVLGFREGEAQSENGRRTSLSLSKNAARMTIFEPGRDHPDPDRKGTITLRVDDVRRLYKGVKDRVSVEWGPVSYDDERREFAFHDPDGHLILVSENPNLITPMPDA